MIAALAIGGGGPIFPKVVLREVGSCREKETGEWVLPDGDCEGREEYVELEGGKPVRFEEKGADREDGA